MVQTILPPLDLESDKRKALARIYSLLIKLAEEDETNPEEVDQRKEILEPLKANNPSRAEYNLS